MILVTTQGGARGPARRVSEFVGYAFLLSPLILEDVAGCCLFSIEPRTRHPHTPLFGEVPILVRWLSISGLEELEDTRVFIRVFYHSLVEDMLRFFSPGSVGGSSVKVTACGRVQRGE